MTKNLHFYDLASKQVTEGYLFYKINRKQKQTNI